jgi:hypothetical protein
MCEAIRQGMARRAYEKTQKGNPHELPVKQHVFPARSITRFATSGGVVQLCDLVRQKTRAAAPGDVMFCAMRAWDLRAERGFMKPIEDEFQGLAEKIISGILTTIGPAEKGTVDRFFALWKWRAHFRDADSQEVQFNGVTGERWTQDQEERFEKAGVLFHREGGKAPAHRLYGIQLQVAIDHECSVLSAIQWGIIQAVGGQFIVPDNPTISFIPLHPTLCLCGGEQEWIAGSGITKGNVIDINRHMLKGCKTYYFANNVAECF